MTKEECIGLLKRYAEYNGMGIPNLVGCREAMRMAAELLERPSIPSNLDEAAEEYSLDVKAKPYGNIVKEAFKDGATWRDSQIPELPSNLDEAAEEWCKRNNKGIALCADKKSHYLAEGMYAFKAGTEWMAGQFQKIDGELVDWYETNGVDYCHGISTNESFEVPEGFYIRKK